MNIRSCFAAVVFVVLAVAALAVSAVLAEEVALDRILVTPYGFEELITKTSASVSIINQSDIRNSAAQTIPEILKSLSGLEVKDYYGNGTKVNIDMRGFGEFASQNTLVLIDGRRVNEIDLGGVDWTQVPLDSIERIEIVRGKGTVLYGDNAANGVINIITKKGRGKPEFEFETAAGSYNYEKQRLSMHGSQGMLSYFLNTSRQFTNGYRDNSDFSSQDVSARFGLEPADKLSFGISGSYHDADYGMSGALRESQLLTYSRRDTIFPLDTAGEKDWYTALDCSFDAAENFQLKSQVSFRQRRLDNQQLSSQSVDGRRIETFAFTPSFTLTEPLLGKESKLIAGYDLYRIDSLIDAYSFSGASYYQGEKTRATDIDKDSGAYYLQEQLSLSEKLIANAGYRYDKTRYSFLSLPQEGAWTADLWWNGTEVNDRILVKKRATDLGLSYIYSEDSNVFADYSRNYRLPTTDEYYSLWAWPPVNINLKPQTADCYTLGANHSFGKNLKARASLFTMSVRNELYYDPLTYTNTNYDKTRHRGFESEIEYSPISQITVSGGYTFTEAFFDGGAYNRNQIPMVPRHKLSAAVAYKPADKWLLNLNARYSARQYLINDQSHDYTPLKDYYSVDAKVSYSLKQGKVYIGIANIFDQRYSEYAAISTVYNEKGYYPAPGRNFTAGCTLTF